MTMDEDNNGNDNGEGGELEGDTGSGMDGGPGEKTKMKLDQGATQIAWMWVRKSNS
jgi:hypothetical protein